MLIFTIIKLFFHIQQTARSNKAEVIIYPFDFERTLAELVEAMGTVFDASVTIVVVLPEEFDFQLITVLLVPVEFEDKMVVFVVLALLAAAKACAAIRAAQAARVEVLATTELFELVLDADAFELKFDVDAFELTLDGDTVDEFKLLFVTTCDKIRLIKANNRISLFI